MIEARQLSKRYGQKTAPGVEISGRAGPEELQVTGISPRSIGLAAAQHGSALFELGAMTVSLEEASWP